MAGNVVPLCRYIISAESGNVLIWNRLTQMVIYKDEQPGIRQLTLMEDGTKVLAISRPNNAPGVDLARVGAAIVVRTVPGE